MTEPMIEDEDDFYSITEVKKADPSQPTDTAAHHLNEAVPPLPPAGSAGSEHPTQIAHQVDNASADAERSNAPLPESTTLGQDGSPNGMKADEPPKLDAVTAESRIPTLSGPEDAETAVAGTSVQAVEADAVQENGAPEFEEDSSPYVSSSEDSTDSSDDDSSDDDYPLLDPREQARILMADAGSDDEGGKKDGRPGGPRTQNEQMDEIVEMPDLQITPDMKIEELGNVQVVIDNVALIKAKTSGEYQVLESSSVLCLEDRKLIGVVAETIGRVEEPMYVVRFTNPSTLQDMGIEMGKTIFYLPSHSHFLFTKALHVKGSDASNLHDEEVAENEMDFSDDEAEAAYKASIKKQRQAKKDARSAGGTPSTATSSQGRGPGWGSSEPGQYDPMSGPTELSYDDNAAADELYTPLARPTTMMSAGNVARDVPNHSSSWSQRGGSRGRDRGRHSNRGRGNRQSHHQHQHHQQGRNRDGFAQSPNHNHNHNHNPNSNQYQNQNQGHNHNQRSDLPLPSVIQNGNLHQPQGYGAPIHQTPPNFGQAGQMPLAPFFPPPQQQQIPPLPLSSQIPYDYSRYMQSVQMNNLSSQINFVPPPPQSQIPPGTQPNMDFFFSSQSSFHPGDPRQQNRGNHQNPPQ